MLLFCVIPKLSSLLIVFLGAFCVFRFIKGDFLFRFNKLTGLFILLFLSYLITDLIFGIYPDSLKIIERKLSFIVFPIIFAFQPKKPFSVYPIFSGLIIGVIITSVLGLVASTIHYFNFGDFNNSFGSTTFSFIHHPTYFSVFLVVSMTISLYGFNKKWRFYSKRNVLLFGLFAICMQFFCFSLSGMIFLFLFLLILFYVWLWKTTKKQIFIIGLILLPIFPVIAYHSNIHIEIQVNELVTDVKNFIQQPEESLQNHARPYRGIN